MRGKALDVAAELGSARVRGQRSEIREAQALLEWMEDNHFTFLGYREYRLRRGPRRDRLVPVPRSGLGIMRPKAARKPKTIVLTGDVRAFARSAEPLIITKANSIATVHRSTYLDYIGVKTYDAAGNVTGERRFIGLWTSSAYSRSPGEIPVLRHKIQRVVGHFGLKPSSHDHKALVHALETFPRDELFQATVPDLVRIVRGIVNLYERAQVRLFVRRDVFRRFYSCLVYVPRDRYNTQARERIEKLALEAFGGLAIESQVSLSESVLARLHMLVRTPPESNAGVDAVELERRITETVRTWQDQLKDSLLDDRGEAEALRLFRAWGGSFPAAYQEDTPLEVAVDDVAALERLVAEPAGLHMALYRRKEQPPHKLQFKLLSSLRPIPISDVLPTIENLGLKLISERPYEIDGATGVVLDPGFRARTPEARPHRPRERWAAAHGDVCESLDGPGRQRRIQQARARRGPQLARGRRAPHLCALVRPAGPPAVTGLHRGGAREQRGGRRPPASGSSSRASTRPFREPSAVEPRARTAGRWSACSPESRGSTTTAYFAPISRRSMRLCGRTISGPTPPASIGPSSRSSWTRAGSPRFRSRSRCSRSSCTRRVSRACTCEWAASLAAACAGPTGATTSAPKSSAS